MRLQFWWCACNIAAFDSGDGGGFYLFACGRSMPSFLLSSFCYSVLPSPVLSLPAVLLCLPTPSSSHPLFSCACLYSLPSPTISFSLPTSPYLPISPNSPSLLLPFSIYHLPSSLADGCYWFILPATRHHYTFWLYTPFRGREFAVYGIVIRCLADPKFYFSTDAADTYCLLP